MRCPRRNESVFGMKEGEDLFRGESCSYCGSLEPDTLMARLELGDIELGPTDKDYKVYVTNKGGAPLVRDHSKFYFQHLSDAQMKRYIELHNEKKIHYGYPGYLYTKPFFTRAEEPEPPIVA